MKRVSALLLLFLHLLLEGLQGSEVAESRLLDGGSCYRLRLLTLLGAAAGVGGAALGLGGVFGDAAVAQDDSLVVLVELNHLEVELVAELGLCAVFLDEVLGRREALYTMLEADDGALVEHFGHLAVMDRADGEDCLEHIPGIVLELLVAEAETTVALVDLEHLHLDVVADLRELAGVFDLLGPAEVGDVDQAVNALLDLDEHAEVSEVAHLGGVAAADGVFLLDVLPGILLELLEAEAHLALLAVERQNHGLDLVAGLEEVLRAAEVLAPAHLADVDEAFDAGLNLDERTVVGHYHYAALDVVAHLEVGVEVVPGMGHELLDAERDALLLVVEVDDDHLDVLVELNDLMRVGDAAPAEVGDVYETVHAAEVDEHAVVGDVLHLALEHLTLLELGDDLLLLLLELGLDESLVADDDVLVFLVDLHDLELHVLADEDVIVADGTHVDLRAGQERLDAEHVDDHTALGAALDVAVDDLVVLERLVDAVPAAGLAGLLVAETELAVLVLEGLDIDFNLVAFLEVGVIAEFADGDDGV